MLNWIHENLGYEFYLNEIKYGIANLNIKDTKFDLVAPIGVPMIKVDFPALEFLRMDAVMDSNSWWLPNKSEVAIELNKFDVNFNIDLYVTDKGYLRPQCYSANITWGDSYFYHNNMWIQAFLRQFVSFILVMVENSVFFVGDVVFTKLGEPVLTSFLNEYRLPLNGVHTPFRGQSGVADFTLDYRHTESPIISVGQMDSKFFGEILYKDHVCTLENEPFDFLENDEEDGNNGKTSQIVMTDSAFSCAMNSLAKSPLGHFDFD